MVASNAGNFEDRPSSRAISVVERTPFAETKASLKTTELWVCIATVAGVLIATQQLDNMDAWDGWRLVSALVIGYMLSRGLAKAGSGYADRD